MPRAGLVLLLALPLCGCAEVLRPLTTTDAATGLEQVTRSQEDELEPAVSPDGRELAYEASATPGGAPHVEVMSLLPPRRVLYSSGATEGADPTWTPDGSSVVFVGRTKNARPRLLETYGQGVRPVFLADVGDPSFGGTHPAVSPDGKLVAMSIGDVVVRQPGWRSARRYDDALGVTDMLGSGLKVIQRGRDVTYSPDGEHLAFVREVRGHEHVFVADADGAHAAQITDGSDDDESPTFSPDGAFVAFCAKDGVPPGVRANLFVVRTDGSGLVQLTEGDRVACKPSWSRDGTIYFHARAHGRFHVFRLRPLLRKP